MHELASDIRMVAESPHYRSKTGVAVSGISTAAHAKILSTLTNEYGITTAQIAEAASYSMAMVVRSALGLSATGGKVCFLVNDSLCGVIALATARHLANGGADPDIVLIAPSSTLSAEISHQLRSLQLMKLPVYDWKPSGDEKELTSLLETCHNAVVGVNGSYSASVDFELPLARVLNDVATPLHCFQVPIGVDGDSGAVHADSIFAASTLSLGIPFVGLYTAREHVGRHYVCDISIPRNSSLLEGQDLSTLFADQPVVQLLVDEALSSRS